MAARSAVTGRVIVADTGNHTIRKVASDGAVSTLAGLAGSAGNANGVMGGARFDNPFGVAADPAGNVYVADSYNQRIRAIQISGPNRWILNVAGGGVTGAVYEIGCLRALDELLGRLAQQRGAEGREGVQVGLDPRPAPRIRARDGEGDLQGAGSCCVRQWIDPNPQISSTQLIPITSCSRSCSCRMRIAQNIAASPPFMSAEPRP